MEEMIKAIADKTVTEIIGDEADKGLHKLLRILCTKAFIKGGIFGIDVSAAELRAAKARIAELEGEVWDLKREIKILS